MESWCCGSAGMKNVGRGKAHQIAPRMRAAASGRRRSSRRGKAKPRRSNSSPSGPVSVTRVRAEGRGAGASREGALGSWEEPGAVRETDDDGGVPRPSGPPRNGAGEQAADTGPAAAGACRHDGAGDGGTEGGHLVERV